MHAVFLKRSGDSMEPSHELMRIDNGVLVQRTPLIWGISTQTKHKSVPWNTVSLG